jgi:hypothetical protein
MGMKPEYYPRGYVIDRPRRTQPAVGTKGETKGQVVAAPSAPPPPQPDVRFAPTTPAPPSETESLRPAPPALAIDRQAARLGVIWAEILGAPRAKQKGRSLLLHRSQLPFDRLP